MQNNSAFYSKKILNLQFDHLDGRLIKEIQPDGSYWETTYQDVERKISRVRKDSSHWTLARESYNFDRRGNVISYTDGANKTITREYDKLNRLKVEITPGETPDTPQRRTEIAYNGNTITVTNAQGEKGIFTKDALGRTTSIFLQDANNQKISETTYSYSTDKIRVTETKGSVSTTIVLDAFGNTVSADRVDSNEGFWKRLWNATLGNPRFQGGLMAVGGAMEMLGGAALWIVPDPTLLTKIGGGSLILHGADSASAGWTQMWSGQTTQTFTAQGISKGLQSVGVPSPYASMVGDLSEFGLAAVPLAVVAKISTAAGKVAVQALHGGPVWQVGKHGDMPVPRPIGTQSHHGVNSIWMEANIPGYKASGAPAVLMRNEPFHNATRGVFNRMRVEIAMRQGVSPRNVDWSRVQPGTAWRLAEEQFEAAGVPLHIRAEYFQQFNQYLNSLKIQTYVP